jgi:glyoxylase-like metal-dependent hydrolase (beta-lactamase superfamily II)
MSTAPVLTDWFEVVALDDGVRRIRERWVDPYVRCNIWHVAGRDRDLLVDTGFGFRPLRSEIESLRDRPVIAVASHTHFDHIGGHHEFDGPGDERVAHVAEAHVLADPTDRDTVFDGYRHERVLMPPRDDVDTTQWSVLPAPATRTVDEGDVIDLGDRVLEVVHLPGHSPGSIALLERATRTVFTGDVVYDGVLFDHLFHSDRERYRESLVRLLELPADTFHCGHEDSFGRPRLAELIDDYLIGRMPRSG